MSRSTECNLLVLMLAASLYCCARGQTPLSELSRLRCEQEVYRVQEGSRPSVDVCAVEITGRVEDDVQFRTVDGTATGGDFEDVFSNRTLDGTGRICVSVAITDDGDFEREEYFSVELMSFQQTPVPSGSCMVIITDNDGPQVECPIADVSNETDLSYLDVVSEGFCLDPPKGTESCGPGFELDDCTRWTNQTFTAVQSADQADIADYFQFPPPPGCTSDTISDVLEFLYSQRSACRTSCALAIRRDNCNGSVILVEGVQLDPGSEGVREARAIAADCSMFDLQCCSPDCDPVVGAEEATEESSKPLPVGVVAGVAVAGLLLLVLVISGTVLLVLLVRRRRRLKNTPQVEIKPGATRAVVYKPKKNTSNENLVETNSYTPSHQEQTDYEEIAHNINTRTYQDWRNIFASLVTEPSLLKFGEPLGEGEFARVYKGELTTSNGGSIDVAIKTLKNVTTSVEKEVEDFLSESALMLELDHHNVMKLVGVCFDTHDLLPVIVLPFMANGDLRSFLQAKRSNAASGSLEVFPEGITEALLLGMCYDIASGMEYLARNRYVHRDLAARNCMVDENLGVKVADFGLSRDVYQSDYYRLTHSAKLPVKWMSPESLYDNIFTEKSDVWSLGVVCWEVFSLGRKPYPGVDNVDIPEYISNGNTLKQPPLCPNQLYGVLQNTWNLEPEERLSFSQIVPAIVEIAGVDPNRQKDMNDYFVLEPQSNADLSRLGDQEQDDPAYFVVDHKTNRLLSASHSSHDDAHAYFTLENAAHSDKQDTQHSYFVLDKKSDPPPPNDDLDDNLYSEVDYRYVLGNGSVLPALEYEVPTASPAHSTYEVPVSSTATDYELTDS